MNRSDNTPLLVGFGVATQRELDPLRAREAIDLMLDAVRVAAQDPGCAALLPSVQRIAVPRGRWSYSNPGGMIAGVIGARHATTVLSEVGVLQQTLIGETCNQIASGQIEAALVVGGDTGYRILRARQTGLPAFERESGSEPDVTMKPHNALRHDAELRAGLQMPVGLYAICESAFRARHGWDVDTHRDHLARLCARLSEIAADNPHAWKHDRLQPHAIRTPSPDNARQAFPYNRLHCSNWSVDQASTLLFCSRAKALELGIPQERWLYPLASTESNHMVAVCARAELGACPGAGITGRAALEVGGLAAHQVDLVDLYSCFPLALALYAKELGLAPDRDLSVTGGMAFAGGPYNNYVLQSTCRMAELLRAGAGRTGLVSSVSGIVTKQAFGLWSRDPGPNPFVGADLSDTVAAQVGTRPVVENHQGGGVIAGYTVLFDPAAPPKGIVVADIEGGRRAVGVTHDENLVAAMQVREFCGVPVQMQTDGRFALAGGD